MRTIVTKHLRVTLRMVPVSPAHADPPERWMTLPPLTLTVVPLPRFMIGTIATKKEQEKTPALLSVG